MNVDLDLTSLRPSLDIYAQASPFPRLYANAWRAGLVIARGLIRSGKRLLDAFGKSVGSAIRFSNETQNPARLSGS